MSDGKNIADPTDDRHKKLADTLTALRDQREELIFEQKQLTDAITQLTADREAATQKCLHLSRLISFLEEELKPKPSPPEAVKQTEPPPPVNTKASSDLTLRNEELPPVLHTFFEKHGYTLYSGRVPPGESDPIYKFAKRAIKHLKLFEIFRKHIGSSNAGQSFSLDLSKEAEEGKAFIRGLFEELATRGIIEYSTQNDCCTIKLKTKEGTDWITGRWGELALAYLLRNLRGSLQQENTALPQEDRVPFRSSVLCNLILKKPDQTAIAMELDVILLVNDKDLYIFESKCGKDKDIKTWRERTKLFETPISDTPDAPIGEKEILGCKFFTVVPMRDTDTPPPEAPLRLLTFNDIITVFKEELRHQIGLAKDKPVVLPDILPDVSPMQRFADFLGGYGYNLLSQTKNPNPFGVTGNKLLLKIIENRNVFNNFRNLIKKLTDNEATTWNCETKTNQEWQFVTYLLQQLSSAKKKLIRTSGKKKNITITVLNSAELKNFFTRVDHDIFYGLIAGTLCALQSKIGKNKSLKAVLYTDLNWEASPDLPPLPKTVLQINNRLFYVFDTYLTAGFTEARCKNARALVNKAAINLKKAPNGPFIYRFIAVPWQDSPPKKNEFKGINTASLTTFIHTVSTLIIQDLKGIR